MLRRLSTLAVVSIMTFGCVSVNHVPIEQSATSKITGKEVVVVKRPMPDFNAMTADKVATGGLFGAIGGAIAGASMISAGNSLIQENGVPDPAYAIGEELAQLMESKYDTKYVGVGSSVVDDDEVASVEVAYKEIPLALDVMTYNWGFAYFPMSWSEYRVFYNARLRLIDTSTASIIAEGSCTTESEETDNPPTYDDLVGNRASGLMAELKKLSRDCAQQFSTKYLNM